jgi:hypothetical protein
MKRDQPSQTTSFSVPVIAMSRPSSTRSSARWQLDGQQLAVPAGIFRDLVSARGKRAALGFGQFPYLDCPHLLRPSSFAAALAYPVRSPIESVPRIPTDIPRNGDAGGSKPIRGSSGQSPVLGARTLTNRERQRCLAQMVLPALPCSLE